MKTLYFNPKVLISIGITFLLLNQYVVFSFKSTSGFFPTLSFGSGYTEEMIVDNDNLSKSNPSKYLSIWLEAGKMYVIETKADFRIADLDIELRNSRGYILADDDTSDQEASIIFSPRQSGTYQIIFTAYEFTQGYADGFYDCVMTH
jgi:hypothetical protein